MALRRPTIEPEDQDEPEQKIAVNRPAPTPVSQPTSAPPVPRELMSARPAMTKVVPRSPAAMQAANQQAAKPEPPAPLTPEEEAERQQRIEYLKSLRKPDKRGRGGKKWLLILIIILLLIIAGLAGAYWFINRKPAAPAKTSNNSTNTTQTQTTPQQQPSADANFKDYSSTNFALGLKYPTDWTLNDTANQLTIISPVTKLPGADGQDASGAVLVTIRHKQPSLAEFKAGNAVAVLDSKNVKYTAPATGQRGTTYLSYVQYATTTVKGALDGIYITGNAGYTKGQAIPQADVIKVDPLVTVTFLSCTTNCAPGGQSTEVNATNWSNNQLNATVETILQSLSLN